LAVGQIVENVERRGKSAVRTGVAIHSLVQMDVVCFNRRCATEQIPMLPLLYRQPIVRHGAMQPIENVPLGHQRATWIGQHLRNRWHDALFVVRLLTDCNLNRPAAVAAALLARREQGAARLFRCTHCFELVKVDRAVVVVVENAHQIP
jgi:hypothetical protein